jgi:hypothetical protein
MLASAGSYQAVLVASAPMIEQPALAALATLAADGVPVAFSGELPQRQPGYLDADRGDREVRRLVDGLLQHGAQRLGDDASAIADALQAQTVVPVRHLGSGPIRSVRRTLGPGEGIVLLANQGAGAATLELELEHTESLWWFDAMSGAVWPAEPTDGRVLLSLRGFESRFLVYGVPRPETIPVRVPDSLRIEDAARDWSLTEWTLAVGGGRGNRATLKDWREEPALRHARVGTYSHRFVPDAMVAGASYLLDLGLVQGSALVRVNGKEIARASLPPFLIDISAALSSGENIIEIEVLAPLRNHFVGRALAADERYSHMTGYERQLVAAGLIGPVRIVEVAGTDQSGLQALLKGG